MEKVICIGPIFIANFVSPAWESKYQSIHTSSPIERLNCNIHIVFKIKQDQGDLCQSAGFYFDLDFILRKF